MSAASNHPHRIRFALAAVVLVSAPVTAMPVLALDYPVSCRAEEATATVTTFAGLDTQHAIMSGRHTLPDAVQHCQSTVGSEGREPRASAVRACVARFMADEARGEFRSEANCRAGTILVSWPRRSAKLYRFPIPSHCAGENATAVALFGMLCPSYKGKVEEAAE